MTKIIGLTGGIGSGKTTVASIFREYGIPVYIADDAGKEVMQSEGILKKIRAQFGDILFFNGVLDRKGLAEIVFSDKKKLEQLNAIVHPEVGEHFNKWFAKQQQFDYVIYESAILFESGGAKKCDTIIAVVASESIRIQRVMERDAVSNASVVQRIQMQWTDKQRIENSDFVITNDTFEATKEQVVKILNFL
ncbi:MAG: dephospho-CoA kinase [Flavobacterium sp.]